MSVRWRRNGPMLCGAKCKAEDGDTYIDDNLHYQLAVVERVLIPDPDERANGIWRWKSDVDKSNP